MNTQETVDLGGRCLTIDAVDALARGSAKVEIPDDIRTRLQHSYDFLRSQVVQKTPIYGLTTGCGPLAKAPIPPERREEFQRNLVRSHAVTLGAPHPGSFVRAAMAVRAHVLARGYSGVHPQTVDVLAAMLNHGLHPVVREIGGVGASGDLVELAQVALAVIGEGSIERNAELVSAAQALRDVGSEPLVPRYREGLALMNGTSFHTGAAAVLMARARRIAAAAQVAAVMLLEAMHGQAEAFDAAFHELRKHPGQRAVAERVAAMTAESRLLSRTGNSAVIQDAYTLRCIPQILGAVLDSLAAAAAVIEAELDSVTDNPLFLVDEQRVVHGGNFHGQPVAMALDQMKAAAVELGVVSERRIARVLDPTLNAGLPPFLISNGAGLHNGFMGLQYCASAMAAENAVLAAPAAIHSVPTNANNQDVVSMAMVAARQTRQVLDNVERMIAIELLCAAQALDRRDLARAGVGTRAAHALIRKHAAPLIEDRSLYDDVAALCQLIDAGRFQK